MIFTYQSKEVHLPGKEYLGRDRKSVAMRTQKPRNYRAPITEKIIFNGLPEDANLYHRNYLDYLAKAYNCHGNIVISPNIIWYTILSELSRFIVTNNEECRHLFTRSDKKETIIVHVDDPTQITLSALKQELKKQIPVNVDLFLPAWSTTTNDARLACLAAFCEACTPYYSYMTMLCGFNSIKIDGTLHDWGKMQVLAGELSGMIPGAGGVYMKKVENQVGEIVQGLQNDNAEFFKDVLKTEICGSGNQQNIGGWFINFFMEIPRTPHVENFNSHIARVPYINYETKRKFNLCYGLFSTKVEDGFWVPSFSHCINEKLSEPEPAPEPILIIHSQSIKTNPSVKTKLRKTGIINHKWYNIRSITNL